MTRFEPPITRVETARGHHYVDGNNTRVPGVTTILSGGLPKPALINWSANATAEAAVDQWDDLSHLTPSKRLEKLKKARYEERDRAARRGTEVHDLAEQLVQGHEVEVPEELTGYVESYVDVLDAFGLVPVHVEVSIASYQHGYAGTTDLIADFPNGLPGYEQDCPRLLMDLKTNRSGIFGETALQLAAYRYADVLINDEGEHDMIDVDGCAAVHIRPDGADLIPVTAGETQFRQFLYVQQVAEFDRTSRDLIGAPITAPGTTPRRRLEVLT